jgi:hypothetical protein
VIRVLRQHQPSPHDRGAARHGGRHDLSEGNAGERKPKPLLKQKRFLRLACPMRAPCSHILGHLQRLSYLAASHRMMLTTKSRSPPAKLTTTPAAKKGRQRLLAGGHKSRSGHANPAYVRKSSQRRKSSSCDPKRLRTLPSRLGVGSGPSAFSARRMAISASMIGARHLPPPASALSPPISIPAGRASPTVAPRNSCQRRARSGARDHQEGRSDHRSGAPSLSLRSMPPTLLVDIEIEPRRQSRRLGGVADWTGLTGGAAVACPRS